MHNEAGYGKRLRIARETAGLSVNEVAERLRLQVKVVLSLELEKQGKELAPAFVRGYLRNYSHLVGENTEEIIRLYNQNADNDPALIQLDNIDSSRLRSAKLLYWVGTLSLIVALLWASVVWWQKYYSPPPGIVSTSLQPTVEEITATAPEPLDAFDDDRVSKPDTERSIPTQDQQTQQIATATSVVGKEDSAVTVEQTEPENDIDDRFTEYMAQYDADTVIVPDIDENEVNPVAPEGTDRLDLTFAGVSWIEVVDAQDYRLIYGLFDETDSPLSVQGSAPFQVIVGDANVVEIAVNDQVYELRRHRRSNNTARVLLGDENPTTE